MPLLLEGTRSTVTTSDLLRDVLLASLAFLSALQIREAIVLVLESVSPPGIRQRIAFVSFVALFILLLTIVIAIVMS